MATHQFFALDITHDDYAAAIAALASATSTNRGYTVTQVLRTHADNSGLRIVCAYVDEADLVGPLAGLHENNYPNALCRHRFTSLAAFRRAGFHMLGESVRSYEGVAGRTGRHVRPQQAATEKFFFAPTGDFQPRPGGGGYGAGDGSTDFDAFNGSQDNKIFDGAVAVCSAKHKIGHSYFLKGGPHVRFGHLGAGGNIDFNNGVGDNGSIAMEDATGLGEAGKIRVYMDDDGPLGPAMFWGSYTNWEHHKAELPGWEDYDGAGVYVYGLFQDDAPGQSASNGLVYYDADVDDVTVDATTLLKQHLLLGKSALADLSGATGRGRFYVQHNFGGGSENWNAVKVWNGTAFTDATTAANDATADDFEIIAAGAPDGAYTAFISDVPFSVVSLNLSQALAGGTVQIEYSQGGGSYGTFTGLSDPSAGLTAGTASYLIAFNPKSDWAQDTIDGATGYVVRIRKTGGTVTTAARGDQAQRQRRACFIHRWNDGAPVRGMCVGNAQPTTAPGLRYRCENKGNYEFINCRFATGSVTHTNTCDNSEVTFTGCQLITFASHQFTSGAAKITLRESTIGTRFWSIADHIVQSGDDPIFTDPVKGLVAGRGDDPKYYVNRARWSDLCYCSEGLYKNGANPRWTLQGFVTRKSCVQVMGMNDILFDLLDTGANDNHFFAVRNDCDFTNDVVEGFGFEEVLSCEFYAAGTGGANMPVVGDGSDQRMIKLNHGYLTVWNGREDASQPGRGFGYVGDGDRGEYATGNKFDGNELNFVAFKDFFYTPVPNRGECITASQERAIKARNCVFDNCAVAALWGRDVSTAVWCFVYDASSDTYTDITANVLPSSAGLSAAMFPATPAAGDMCIFAVQASLNQPSNRVFRAMATPAAMGTAVVSWLYRNDAGGWTAAPNVTGGDLTTSDTMRFDKVADHGAIDIGGTLYNAIAVRLDSGAFATPPVLDQAHGRLAGGALDIENCIIASPRDAVFIVDGGFISTNGSFIRDVNNTVIYGPGQDDTTKLWAWGSLTPHLDVNEWKALVKAANADSLEPCVFGQGLVTVPAP